MSEPDKIPKERFKINYKNCHKYEPLYQLAMEANRLGMEKKQILSIEARAAFGEGVEIVFEFKQPFPGEE